MTQVLGDNSSTLDESILDTVKDIIGIDRKNYDFDRDLVLAINAVLAILHQEGIADKYYTISDNTKTWRDILLKEETPEAISMIQQWVGMRTKLLFDPPTSSVLNQALQDSIAELEWRSFITNNYVGEIGEWYGSDE